MSQGEDAGKRRDGLTTRREISPNELALQLGVSPASALRACKQRRVRCVRFGKRYLIPADEADRILNAGIPPAAAGLPPFDSDD
jgi:hypothetical protein